MSLISRRIHDFSDHEQFYDCGTIILYDICIAKFVNPSSAGDFACSAGELGIESESLSLQPKAADLASMLNASICKPERNDKRSITFFQLVIQNNGNQPYLRERCHICGHSATKKQTSLIA